MANHIHNQNPILMQLLNHPLGWHTHRTNKQLRPALNHNLHQLLKFTKCVIMVRLARIAANLRQREVHAKRQVGVLEVGFHLGDDLAQLVGRVHEAADDAEAAGVGDCGGEVTAGDAGHAGEEDWVLDAQEGG